MVNKIIEIKSLTRIFNVIDRGMLRYRQILYKDFNFVMRAGEFVAMVGPSGCGKTTLLNIIGGLDSLCSKKRTCAFDPEVGEKVLIPEVEDCGKVYIDGNEISQLCGNRKAEFINKNIGFIFQFHHLIPELTAWQNVALPIRIRGKSNKEARKRALELLEEMGLGRDVEKKPSVLSGGEKQRVAIARSLANSPKIILADEPTGNLNIELKESILELLFSLNKTKRVTILMVTHDKTRLYDQNNELRIDRFLTLPIIGNHSKVNEENPV